METMLESKVFKSRWGHHPCDYKTFLELKKLNYLYFKALKMRARWERWDRKEPQNRTIKKWKRDLLGRKIGKEIIGHQLEPKLDNIFLEKKITQGYVWDRETQKYVLKDYEIVKIININIMEEYQKAKHPKKNKEDIVELKLTKEDINKWYEKSLV